MQRVEKLPLTRAITDIVSNAPVICEEAEQVAFGGASMLKFNLVGVKYQVAGYRTKVHLRYFRF